MNEAIKIAVQLQSDRLRDESQAENKDFINKLDDNIKKIIKDQKSHAVAANLSELDLKKILIDKIESNKSIHRSDEQKNLYKDKNEEPSAGSNRGSKRRRAGKEPESTSAPKEKTSKPTGKSTEGSKSHQKYAGEFAQAEEPMHTTKDLEKHMEDPRTSFNELFDTPLDFSAFVINRLKIDTLTSELLAGPTFKLTKGSCKSLPKIYIFSNEDQGCRLRAHQMIEDLVPNIMWSQVPVSYDRYALWGISHWGRERQQFYRFTTNRESARDVYFKRIIIVVRKIQIVEWHNYKYLDWITIHRDGDKFYTFKEGNFNRLRIQDIKDMLLLLIQDKLTNLTDEERLAFNVSLRMLQEVLSSKGVWKIFN
uniref:Uncharacterized protein n=1 Tax=Tanacetum cinerariifolium TaxID=118510 RepID=A0A6L2KX28_TANCI|nr:hypothetical protein [Tanacetum cinerariifolium]